MDTLRTLENELITIPSKLEPHFNYGTCAFALLLTSACSFHNHCHNNCHGGCSQAAFFGGKNLKLNTYTNDKNDFSASASLIY